MSIPTFSSLMTLAAYALLTVGNAMQLENWLQPCLENLQQSLKEQHRPFDRVALNALEAPDGALLLHR
jgi:hypothetical protein